MGARISWLEKNEKKEEEGVCALLDPDSMSVVLSFCDLRTRMQIDRTCTVYHSDVNKFHKPYRRAISELRTIVATGEVSSSWLHIMRGGLPGEWTSALLNVWIHAPKSRVRLKDFARARGIVDALKPLAHADWRIPRASHLMSSLVNRHSWLGTHRVPVCLYVDPNGRPDVYLAPPAPPFQLLEILTKHPHIWYGVLKVVMLAIEYKFYNVCFSVGRFAIGL